MSQALQKIGKMIRSAGEKAPAGAATSYKEKTASVHTFAEPEISPEVVYNLHIKQAAAEDNIDELEALMMKEAYGLRETPVQDPAKILEKRAEHSAMDGFDSQKIIDAVNSATDMDAKIKAYLSASNADKIQTPKENGE